ncbi:MAG: alpha/beta hydrolase [Betaproteobacteria bacterium]|nr:alpha/beta hydrolase [Betaproteobacteria bacterium]
MSDWQPDALLAGFEQLRLEFPADYDGPVVATLVRLPGPRRDRAALYVHGFVDYFFQAHMAERFAAEGYAFYALDLRKHGRSLLAGQHPCYCSDLSEYYAELTRAIEVIGLEEGDVPLLLAGHSTGGLLAALYAHEGEARARLGALWLNSPFFDFYAPSPVRAQIAAAAALGRLFPFLNNPNRLSALYPMSLHKRYRGEWDFDLRLKPIEGFPTYFGWLAAIRRAHARVHTGLAIACPVLAMHSDRSEQASEWRDSLMSADIVLDVADMKRWSPGLGAEITLCEIPGGMHDLVLSRREPRERAFAELFGWLQRRGFGGTSQSVATAASAQST